uniref:Fibronectin type-II domain-containing protein n=1 Tax=Chelonoidis abingdonii TaxID=106734 RepID=A0A8C0GWW3_CHEAB
SPTNTATSLISDLLVAFAVYGGNSNGQHCMFPFLYKTELFHSCTNAGDKKGNFWCATTHNYNQDKLWRYCPDISNVSSLFVYSLWGRSGLLVILKNQAGAGACHGLP